MRLGVIHPEALQRRSLTLRDGPDSGVADFMERSPNARLDAWPVVGTMLREAGRTFSVIRYDQAA